MPARRALRRDRVHHRATDIHRRRPHALAAIDDGKHVVR
jgi:hypothetical protein